MFDKIKFIILFPLQLLAMGMMVASFFNKNILGVCFYGIWMLSLEHSTDRLYDKIEKQEKLF